MYIHTYLRLYECGYVCMYVHWIVVRFSVFSQHACAKFTTEWFFSSRVQIETVVTTCCPTASTNQRQQQQEFTLFVYEYFIQEVLVRGFIVFFFLYGKLVCLCVYVLRLCLVGLVCFQFVLFFFGIWIFDSGNKVWVVWLWKLSGIYECVSDFLWQQRKPVTQGLETLITSL